ncbi:MAG: hypothetical protein ACOX56_02390 [Acholeplasmataceae bacterium]|jgi:hypothetical protein
MQIKRQRISFSAIIFIWLTLFGIQHLILELVRDNEKLRRLLGIILPLVLLVALIGLVLGVKFLIRDDMITITTRDHQVSRILGYIGAVPIIVLILFDYIVKDKPQVNFVVNLVASILLILVGLFGSIYYSIIICQKPRHPFGHDGKVIEAEFEEKDNNLPS